MLQSIQNFCRRNLVSSTPDFGRIPTGVGVGLAAGVTAASTGIGYAIGAQHQAVDVVTHTQVPYPETVTLQTGTHTETGGFHYHYSFTNGRFEYGWDPFYSHDEPTFETHETGRTLYRDVAHHTAGFPHTAIGGALVGFGVGVGLCTAAAIINGIINSDRG